MGGVGGVSGVDGGLGVSVWSVCPSVSRDMVWWMMKMNF